MAYFLHRAIGQKQFHDVKADFYGRSAERQEGVWSVRRSRSSPHHPSGHTLTLATLATPGTFGTPGTLFTPTR